MALPGGKQLDDIRLHFIVGMGRSGTTLLTSLLNNHPSVLSTPENNFLVFNYSEFKDKTFSIQRDKSLFRKSMLYKTSNTLKIWHPTRAYIDQVFANDPELDFNRLVKQLYFFYPLSQSKTNITCIVDKNPEYSLHAETLKAQFPGARFILLVRDYRDNIASRKKVDRSLLKSIIVLAESWNIYYRRLLRFYEKHQDAVLLLRYEDLVSFPEREMKRICNFFELEYTAEFLKPKVSAQSVVPLGVKLSEQEQARIKNMHKNLDKEVSSAQVGSWKRVLTPRDTKLADYLCGPVAARLYGHEARKFSRGERLLLFIITRPMVYFTRCYIYLFDYKYYYLPLRLRLLFKRKKNLDVNG